MSATLALDTLAITKKLSAHGFSREQAEVQAEVLAEVVENNLVTKPYLDIKLAELRNDLLKWFLALMAGQAGLIAWLIKSSGHM